LVTGPREAGVTPDSLANNGEREKKSIKKPESAGERGRKT